MPGITGSHGYIEFTDGLGHVYRYTGHVDTELHDDLNHSLTYEQALHGLTVEHVAEYTSDAPQSLSYFLSGLDFSQLPDFKAQDAQIHGHWDLNNVQPGDPDDYVIGSI